MEPKRTQKIKWSPDFAYAVGLITSDGCLSIDGRHIDFTSKDIELVKTFKKCLGLKNRIGLKTSGYSDKKYNRIQFGDVIFYNWLLEIGLAPRKSKTLNNLKVPNKYFFDFLRGYFDGDGSSYSYWDQRWASSFMFYTVFSSSSLPYLKWLRAKLKSLLKIKGHIASGKRAWQLKYAKRESKLLISKMYYKKNLPCLKRKDKKLKTHLETDNREINKTLKLNGRVLELVDSLD